MPKCKRCKKPLKTATSIKHGYGPICKKKHDAAEAEFLKLQITIDEVLEYQTKMV
ncbi:DUF6011 domain-containing protein [Sporosarcina jiandibaonis]|uniref:DUF6011 domain-containing protein n=1 Tax=Sporosarcina jiandibaonis TaxID=2715535 RepID=UPI0015547679|nr:DUF6011 domain-containing protein [Sporosarcina jiandibaonis]